MKNFKKIICSCLAFGLCIAAPGLFKFDLKSNSSQAYTKPAQLNWDTENKLIFANQNSLLIVEDGTGTTVYLDVPAGYKSGDVLTSGDGVLSSEDLSLAEIYQANPSAHQTPAPENGADLSDWSIVFGENNTKENVLSNTKMNVLMTGGNLKNIYAGHSSVLADVFNKLKGVVEFTITGGSVDSIFTDSGYDSTDLSGRADGSNNATFNLFGGTVKNIVRDRLNVQGRHSSVLNFKGDIEIENDIKFVSANSGLGLNVVGDLTNTINIDLNGSFERSNIVLTVAQDFVSTFDLSKINLKNKPAETSSWQLYKNKNQIRFGNDSKITSVQINGEAKVGETLTVEILPATATFKSITWYRVDEYLDDASIIGAGNSYVVNEEDGGKKLYVIVVDKNNETETIKVEVDEIIKRIDKPQIVKANGKTVVYANGNDLLIAKQNNGTTIYIDAGEIGVLDEADISLKDAQVENAFKNGADLSNVIVSAGCSNEKNSGAIAITMISGRVGEIVVESTNDEQLLSNIVINLLGGKVDLVKPNKQNVLLGTIVNVGGDIKAKILGIQHSSGATELNVIKNITSSSGSVKVVLEKAEIKTVSVAVLAKEGVSLQLSKFKFLKDDEKELVSCTKTVSQSKIELAPIPVESIKIKGNFRVGDVLSVDTTPDDAHYTCTWLRSSTNSIEDAKVIEGETKDYYKLTEKDVDKYIFVIVNNGEEDESFAITEMKIKEAVRVWLIVLISFVGLVVLVLIYLIVWFVLWKKKAYNALFMQKLFEKTDRAFFKKNKKNGLK